MDNYDGKLLLADANGILYAVPLDQAKQFELNPAAAASLIQVDSKTAQTKELETLGVVTQVKGSELPNFRLLMQTEYDR